MPTAFIAGINGQDGAYLAHLLLSKNYRVCGSARTETKAASKTEACAETPANRVIEYSNLQALSVHEQVELLPFDLCDMTSLRRALEGCAPDEIYNLAAQSSVGASWEEPLETGEVTGMGAARLMQAAREVCPQARFFQASSSEMFGRAVPATADERNGSVRSGGVKTVDEKTLLCPDNPYGAAKTYAHHLARSFRESFDMPISCGILFNHESPLRGEPFVTRKVTLAVARIRHGLQDSLRLGNMDVVRDWGFAGDFVRAMWLMLQNEPGDFIVASGQTRPLRDFVTQAFRCANLNADDYVQVDPAFFRPVDMAPVIGDARQSSTRLGWTPQVSFEQTVQLMVEADLNRVAGKFGAVRYFVE